MAQGFESVQHRVEYRFEILMRYMDQGPHQKQGIHAHSLKFKDLEISFDHRKNGMLTGKFGQSRGTVQAGAGEALALQPEHIPSRTASNVQDMRPWLQVFDQGKQKRRGIDPEGLLKIRLGVGVVVFSRSHAGKKVESAKVGADRVDTSQRSLWLR